MHISQEQVSTLVPCRRLTFRQAIALSNGYQAGTGRETVSAEDVISYALRNRNGKTAQRESFRAGYPADVPGSFVRTSRVKDFGQALETLAKQACGCGHP